MVTTQKILFTHIWLPSMVQRKKRGLSVERGGLNEMGKIICENQVVWGIF